MVNYRQSKIQQNRRRVSAEEMNQQIQMAYNAGYTRAMYSSRRTAGLNAYQGQRDYDKVLGYPRQDTIDFDYYYKWYKRGGIATRLINLPAQDTWKAHPKISEDGNTDTPFVQEWNKLQKRLSVFSMMSRADRISGIGKYGVLVIGTRLRATEFNAMPMRGLQSQADIIYLRAVTEANAQIETWDRNRNSPRFGMPETYRINVAGEDGKQSSMVYHWTRVIHLAENREDSETYGTPRLEPSMNYILDLMKLVGGGAESAWLNMRPGTVVKPGDGYKMTTSDSDIEEQVARYAHDPLRMMVLKYAGVDVEQLSGANVPETEGQIDKLIDLISATNDVPRRVLLGSAAGELAAAREDTRQWAGNIAYRQQNYAEPEILREFINRLIKAGALPTPPAGYDVGTQDEDGNWHWPSIITQTQEEEALTQQAKANARATISASRGGFSVTTPEEDRDMLGLPTEPQNGTMTGMSANQLDPPINAPTLGIEAADEQLIQFTASLQKLADQALSGEITQEQFEQELAALVMALSVALYLAASGKTITELDTDDREQIRTYQERALESVPGLARDIYQGRFVDPETGAVRVTQINARLLLWSMAALALANEAQVRGNPDDNYRWDLGATFEHCTDCLRLDGQVHTGAEWIASGWMPQSRRLECGGWNCDCALRRTRAATRGSF